MQLSLEPALNVRHDQGASSVLEKAMVLPRVGHRKDWSPRSRRHILLWWFFSEGIPLCQLRETAAMGI